MSYTDSSPSPNNSNLLMESYKKTNSMDPDKQTDIVLFGLCLSIAIVTCVGGVYSLITLLRKRLKTSLCLIVASMSIDDLVSLVPLSLFMFLQWKKEDYGKSGTICTLSGLLYVFQGLSSNMKAFLIVAYTFYITKRFGVYESSSRPLRMLWAIAMVWIISLIISILPLCGWGRFSPASLGCLPDSNSFYVLLLFAAYSLCVCGLVFFSFPLIYRLLCSTEQQKTFSPSYFEIAGPLVSDGSRPLCEIPSLSRASLEKSFSVYNEFSTDPVYLQSNMVTRSSSTTTDRLRMDREHPRYSPVFYAQKRFSVILAIARIVLWMPMMTQIVVSHIVHVRSTSMETLSFFLTLLSAAVTPMFVLSERWIHLPCGCFINCRSGAAKEPSVNKRRFDFNMSFQSGYGFYKISHTKSPSIEKPSYSNFFNCNLTESRVAVLDSGQIKTLANNEFRTTANEDSSLRREVLLDTTLSHEEGLASQSHNSDNKGLCLGSPPPSLSGEVDVNLDSSSVFDGPERRLSHEECRKIELTDWEWCRSKSERTPRQRSTGGLSIPLCAFQGTVSLQAPTGKTLSLSTYEVSSDGLKISPTTKKVEVYRSKSVGHEPSADEPHSNSSGSGGGEGVGGVSLITGIGDTNVKIHLEVLEICDNEEAMDSVSIISNISQSSTHARSPSLRYSRRENRFVSCDLGETASYSLLIPAINPDADHINIHIPDTVEAHRQNSMRQTQESGGYREEIQLLNNVYRKPSSQRN
ncbi:hypothetical protein AALO_G00197660 [Alosa alosa]|uniref:G-protein coupled receptors family 1 profile domain-containing protein n=2 Tax=Alosa alosa TaxID=278164 RepID=A0AAV6G1P2_9TELE|nr:probable G-protein coupled receptor 149 isoform X1 [Alosa alosa]KAG5269043.1 hypothetical protein AALO_G00197660 [Alosa alosa]